MINSTATPNTYHQHLQEAQEDLVPFIQATMSQVLSGDERAVWSLFDLVVEAESLFPLHPTVVQASQQAKIELEKREARFGQEN